MQALGAAHSALATQTAEAFSEAVRTASATAAAAGATGEAAPAASSPVANHIYVDGASAAASVADAVRFVLPVFQALLIALATD